MERKFNVITFSDVHFSKKNAEPLYKELKEGVYKYIDESDKGEIDLVAITGDYFHEKLQLNSTASILSMKFMNELVELCESKNIPLRVIRGTLTHDHDQLENFRHLERTHNFRIINTVREEEFANEVKVLYVPEEYVTDSDKYYEEFYEKKNEYAYVFFHGTFDFAAFTSMKQESERHLSTAPVFDSKTFLDMCTGYIIGGHIHAHQKYKDRIIYNGSYSANAFDEDNVHGFIVSSIDENNEPVKWELILNELVPSYKTFSIDDTEFREFSIEDKMVALEELVDIADYVRIKLSALDFKTLTELMMFKSKAAEYKNLKLVIEDSNRINISDVDQDKILDEEDLEEEKDDKYSFILEEENDLATSVSKFISVKHGKTIPVEEVREIITEAQKD